METGSVVLVSQRCAHLVHYRVRRAVDVRKGEAKYSEAGIDEQVLPPVVLDEARSVRSTVVLKDQAVGRIVQIGASQEATVVIVERHLNFRPRQPAQDEQHPQAAFHRRLGGGLCQFKNSPELPDPS
jgi:hypothetical protein